MAVGTRSAFVAVVSDNWEVDKATPPLVINVSVAVGTRSVFAVVVSNNWEVDRDSASLVVNVPVAVGTRSVVVGVAWRALVEVDTATSPGTEREVSPNVDEVKVLEGAVANVSEILVVRGLKTDSVPVEGSGAAMADWTDSSRLDDKFVTVGSVVPEMPVLDGTETTSESCGNCVLDSNVEIVGELAKADVS